MLSKLTSPASGGSNPASVISNEVLPEPLGPVTVSRAPGANSTVIGGDPAAPG